MMSKDFAVEVIAKGSYEDRPFEDGTVYTVEATTIHLNHAALNEWILSETSNSRDCYETDQKWEEHKAEYARRREGFYGDIIEALGLGMRGDFDGSISITRAQSEVFTVVRIWANAQ